MNDTTMIVLDQLPSPRITTILPDTICIFNSPIRLEGTPSGGILSGDGVLNDTLFPALAGLGNIAIYYDYTDPSTNCSAYTTENIFIDICNSIEESDLPGTISIFPVPADNEIIINFYLKYEKNLSIDLFNTIGQSVLSINLNKISNDFTYKINTLNITEGFYVMKLNLNKKLFSKKIIIHHK